MAALKFALPFTMQPALRLFLSAAGELTLPKALQESLHLHTGIPLLVSVEDNRLHLQPMNAAYLADLRGSLKEEGPDLTLSLLHQEKQEEQNLEEQKLKRFRLYRR